MVSTNISLGGSLLLSRDGSPGSPLGFQGSEGLVPPSQARSLGPSLSPCWCGWGGPLVLQ